MGALYSMSVFIFSVVSLGLTIGPGWAAVGLTRELANFSLPTQNKTPKEPAQRGFHSPQRLRCIDFHAFGYGMGERLWDGRLWLLR